jgi:uncharacterized protein (DUF433 family)
LAQRVDIYGGADPRDVPNYSVAEAARFLRLRSATVRRWLLGQTYVVGETRRKSRGVIRIAQPSPPTLSFWNLVEVYVLAGIRIQHGVSMPRIRSALKYVADELGLERPLIEKQFHTDGVDLFFEEMSSLINASAGGQAEIKELRGRLKRIDRDAKGLAKSIFPTHASLDEPRHVEINPLRAFGRLVIAGTNIPVEIIAERWKAGESLEDLTDDYGLDFRQVETAARWMAS